jgi:hypothetical protein
MSSLPILTLRLATRGYELNARGTIPTGTWMRYLEHHRWQTFNAEGEARSGVSGTWECQMEFALLKDSRETLTRARLALK